MKLSKRLINALEKQDFKVTQFDDKFFEFEKYSPAGQDFIFTVEGETLEELFDNLYAHYSDFDVSYEAYLWLDDTGHGANGAPYDMKDVYEDMETCAEYIIEVANIVREYYNKAA